MTVIVEGFFREESGQNLVEYALAAGLIGVGTIVALLKLSSILNFLPNAWQQVAPYWP